MEDVSSSSSSMSSKWSLLLTPPLRLVEVGGVAEPRDRLLRLGTLARVLDGEGLILVWNWRPAPSWAHTIPHEERKTGTCSSSSRRSISGR